MPDLGGFPALDVAIGLIFVYFVFSLIASGVNEWISTRLKWRSKGLEHGIRAMLARPGEIETTFDALVNHQLIGALGVASKGQTAQAEPAWKKLPSYLPSPTFSLALFDTLAPDVADVENSKNVLPQIRAKLVDPEFPMPSDVRKTLVTLIDHSDDKVESFRAGVEQWFDNTMDRVAGWYKRRVQIALVVISIAVAAIFNVDSVQIANTLLNNGTVRSAVVVQAQKQDATVDKAAADVDQLKALKLPLGWVGPPKKSEAGQAVDPRARPTNAWGWVGKVFGLLVTGLALSLGAPFWFDLLNRVTRLRNTGPPEGGPRERRPRPDRAPELLASRPPTIASVIGAQAGQTDADLEREDEDLRLDDEPEP